LTKTGQTGIVQLTKVVPSPAGWSAARSMRRAAWQQAKWPTGCSRRLFLEVLGRRPPTRVRDHGVAQHTPMAAAVVAGNGRPRNGGLLVLRGQAEVAIVRSGQRWRAERRASARLIQFRPAFGLRKRPLASTGLGEVLTKRRVRSRTYSPPAATRFMTQVPSRSSIAT
jgi:hypothetical protein